MGTPEQDCADALTRMWPTVAAAVSTSMGGDRRPENIVVLVYDGLIRGHAEGGPEERGLSLEEFAREIDWGDHEPCISIRERQVAADNLRGATPSIAETLDIEPEAGHVWIIVSRKGAVRMYQRPAPSRPPMGN